MNQGIFKVIFNRTLNRFVVVSELAKAAGKGSERAVASSGQFLQKNLQNSPACIWVNACFRVGFYAAFAYFIAIFGCGRDTDYQSRPDCT